MKTTILVLAGVFLFASCAPTESTNKNIETARAMFDAFNRHDWNAMANYYSESASFLDPSYGKEYVTKNAGGDCRQICRDGKNVS